MFIPSVGTLSQAQLTKAPPFPNQSLQLAVPTPLLSPWRTHSVSGYANIFIKYDSCFVYLGTSPFFFLIFPGALHILALIYLL